MSRTDATRCKVCGGPFGAKRLIIEGEAYHDGCALMSHPPHTWEDYARLSNQMAALVKALEAAREYLESDVADGFRPAERLTAEIDQVLGDVGGSGGDK